ncbi:MAG: BTAD domain-containing putative transcriptional regulator [Caldilineaceae bacterium]
MISRETIGVDPAGARLVDAVELERVVKSTSAALNPQSATQLATALASYQGEFLDGFAVEDATRFTEWLVVERERLRYLALDGYQQLTAYYLTSGDYEAGIQVATALLRLDPTDETGHAYLIRLLAYTGQRAAALAQFDTYRRLLQAEFGVEPDAALQALYRQIRDDTLTAPHPVVAETPPPRHNLPAQLTSLLGRQAEITAVQALLRRADVRLITLTGPGGVGKSRLGEAVAWTLLYDFADGVFVVELAAVRDPQLVLSAIAQTLAVRDQGSTPLQERLQEYLQEKQCLLLIDNFEQVIDAAPRLLQLLRACPQVKMLVTSRETLRLRGEQEFPVPTLAPADAVALFVQRAQAVQPTFTLNASTAEIVTTICQQLDYLPLAIELAATQSKLFAPPAILARLQDRFTFLIGRTRDLPDRQRTLRTTLDWSYDLLTAEEKQLFRRLAVFRGGRSLEAVETVCNPNDDERIAPLSIDVLDGLTALLDKSFLYQQTGTGTGEPMMLVTIHEYAMDRHLQVVKPSAPAPSGLLHGAGRGAELELASTRTRFDGSIAWRRNSTTCGRPLIFPADG